MNMKMNHKVITLGLAFGLLGSTGAFAKPSPYFENRGLSHEESTVTRHVPTAETSGTTGYLRAPAAHAVHDDWPSDMLLG
jgi:hypothetical protein